MNAKGDIEVIIKKYSNRRLYDTSDSRYITLDELSRKIQDGIRIKVVDAKSDKDLTQTTLAQIVFENRHASRYLPLSLLTTLVRMDEKSLKRFFSEHLEASLQSFLGQQKMSPASSGSLESLQLPKSYSLGVIDEIFSSNPAYSSLEVSKLVKLMRHPSEEGKH